MKAAIFDLDGTLLDSMWMWRTVLSRYLEKMDVPNHKELNEEVYKMSFADAIAYVTDRLDLGMTAGELTDSLEKYIFYLYQHEIEIKPYVREYLAFLHKEGVKICLATLTDRYMAEAVLERFDVLKYFDYIVTVPEVGATKDHPDIYEDCLKNTGVEKKDAVVFEDAPYCMKTAHDAGFVCYGIEDPWQNPSEEFIGKYCDRFIRSYKDLLNE
ncbi:MAG: HAD family hydrolase [Clostridia bacterium]